MNRSRGAPLVAPLAAPLVAPPVAGIGDTGPANPAPRASLREEQKSLTRNRLLDAAVAVLTEKSLVDTTMEDVAKAAGVTRVTVYAHFPGKGEIVHALAERVYDLMGEVFADLAAVERLTRPEIRRWLDGAVARWRRMGPTLRVVRPAAAVVSRNPATARNQFIGAQQRYVALLLADAARWRDVPPAQAQQRALMAVLQTESFLSAWVVAALPLAADDPLELLTESLCHLLGPALENDERRP